jgi:peptide/nickel transport system permease protein
MDAVWSNEFPTLTATVLLLTAIYVVLNLVADIAYVMLNPIIRFK